jgi:hypothetical protein
MASPSDTIGFTHPTGNLRRREGLNAYTFRALLVRLCTHIRTPLTNGGLSEPLRAPPS